MRGYTAITQQLAQDYNIHGAAVIGQAPGQQAATTAAAAGPATHRAAGASSSAAAAAKAAAAGGGGQAGMEVDSGMSDEELRRFKDSAGEAAAYLCVGCRVACGAEGCCA